jgi:hypothetical protein
LEEILTQVIQTTEVTDIEKLKDDDVGVDYGDHTLDGGEVESFCCANCGEQIASDTQELYEFLFGKKESADA